MKITLSPDSPVIRPPRRIAHVPGPRIGRGTCAILIAVFAAILCGNGCGPRSTTAGFNNSVEAVRKGERDAINASANRVGSISDADLPDLSALPGLRHLVLDGAPITDAGLARLGRSDHLESLSLSGTQATDVGLKTLNRFPNLRFLRLDRCPVTDNGLAALTALPELRHLSLVGTRVTGPGLRHLQSLHHLRILHLDKAPLTRTVADDLRTLDQLRHVSLVGTSLPLETALDLEAVLPDASIAW